MERDRTAIDRTTNHITNKAVTWHVDDTRRRGRLRKGRSSGRGGDGP
jgi:hypothetical protein